MPMRMSSPGEHALLIVMDRFLESIHSCGIVRCVQEGRTPVTDGDLYILVFPPEL